jgi:hypothetical protein
MIDCEEIGCVPKLSQAEVESGEGFWLCYEKKNGTKTIKFTAKLSSCGRIDYAEWVDGSKTKWQNKKFNSQELAREEFDKLLKSKKSENFRYVSWKM